MVFSLGSTNSSFLLPFGLVSKSTHCCWPWGIASALGLLTPMGTYVSSSPIELASIPHLRVLSAAEIPTDSPDHITSVSNYRLSILSLLFRRETRKSSISTPVLSYCSAFHDRLCSQNGRHCRNISCPATSTHVLGSPRADTGSCWEQLCRVFFIFVSFLCRHTSMERTEQGPWQLLNCWEHRRETRKNKKA